MKIEIRIETKIKDPRRAPPPIFVAHLVEYLVERRR
jgi:hypothetical protein